MLLYLLTINISHLSPKETLQVSSLLPLNIAEKKDIINNHVLEVLDNKDDKTAYLLNRKITNDILDEKKFFNFFYFFKKLGSLQFAKDIINNHVLEVLDNKDDKSSYVLNRKIINDILNEKMFFNFFYFFKKLGSLQSIDLFYTPREHYKNKSSKIFFFSMYDISFILYIFNNYIFWILSSSFLNLSFSCFLIFYNCYDRENIERERRQNNLIETIQNNPFKENIIIKEEDKFCYIIIACKFFLLIINAGLLGGKYGASGKYDLFLYMVWYPIVIYIIPIILSIIFFFFFQPDYSSSIYSICHIITMVLCIGTLLLISVQRLLELFRVLKHKKRIESINKLIDSVSVNIFSVPYKFMCINFKFVYYMIVLYCLSIFSATYGIFKIIYIVVKLLKRV